MGYLALSDAHNNSDWYSEGTIPAYTKQHLQQPAPPILLTPDTVSPKDNSTTLLQGVDLSAISPEFLIVSLPLAPAKCSRRVPLIGAINAKGAERASIWNSQLL